VNAESWESGVGVELCLCKEWDKKKVRCCQGQETDLYTSALVHGGIRLRCQKTGTDAISLKVGNNDLCLISFNPYFERFVVYE